jgi:hypothetical protein
VDVEVEDVCDLEVGAIHEYQVAADYDVRVVRGRWRQHDFEFVRAGLHLSSQINRHIPANHYLTLQAGRKPVALGQAWRKMLVVRAVPAAGRVAVVIGIAIVVMSATMFVFALMFAIVAAFMIVAVAMIVIVITVVFLVAVTVVVLRK